MRPSVSRLCTEVTCKEHCDAIMVRFLELLQFYRPFSPDVDGGGADNVDEVWVVQTVKDNKDGYNANEKRRVETAGSGKQSKH